MLLIVVATAAAILVGIHWAGILLPAFSVPCQGSRVLITGCSSGIGRSAALKLAQLGYVVYAGVRNPEHVAALSGIENLTPIILDVAIPEQIRAVVERLEKDGGGLFALINNAGLSNRFPFELEDSSFRRRMMEANLLGPMDLTAACLPMLKASHGRIINIGSLSGERATTFTATYSASKFGMRGWTEGLRRQLRAVGVHASIIEPGFIRTPLAEAVVKQDAGVNYDAKEYSRYFTSDYVSRVVTPKYELIAESTEVTDEAIVHAISSSLPRPRYLLTSAKYLVYAFWFLPDYLCDFLALRMEEIDY